MADHEHDRERRVTRKQLHEDPQAVFEKARGGHVVLVDDQGQRRAVIAVPTDKRRVMFE